MPNALASSNSPYLQYYWGIRWTGWNGRQRSRGRSLPVRVVMSDWRAPRFDGLQLCAANWAGPSDDNVHFVLLTKLSATLENKRAAGDAALGDFPSKPLDVTQLWLGRRVAGCILTDATRVRQLEVFSATRPDWQEGA